MIHLRCPKCKRVMSLDDSKAGKVGRCLACNQKFRVPPDLLDENDSPLEEPRLRPKRADVPHRPAQAPEPIGTREPPPPKNDADVMKLDRYAVDADEGAGLSAAKPNLFEVDEEADWPVLDDALPPARGKKTKRSYLLPVVAGVLVTGVIISGTIAFLFWKGDNTSDKTKTPPAPMLSRLRLQLDGKQVEVPLEFLNVNHVKRGREGLSDYFELAGNGVNIFGKLWTGFEDKWDELMDKPLTLTPQDPSQREGDSHIGLPGKGDCKVVEGKLTIKEVVRNLRPEPFLRGEMELKLKGKGPTEVFDAKGTFEVQVRTFF